MNDAGKKDATGESVKPKKRKLYLILTILLNIAVVGFFIVKEIIANRNEPRSISLSDLSPYFLVFGALCFCVAMWTEYVKYKKMIMTSAGKYDPRGVFHVAMLGKYTDNVTPFGAGGQPFQIHYLHKRGYSSGTSGAVPVAGFLSQQIAFIIIAIVVFIANGRVVSGRPEMLVAPYVGLVFYMVIPAAIILFAFLPKAFNAIVGGVLRLLQKMHIIKSAAEKSESVNAVMNEYVTSIREMNKRPFFTMKLIFISLIYQMAILSIPFFMIRAFGGSGSWWDIFSMTVFIYAAITIIPTPGNSVAAEVSFSLVFSSLSGGLLFWAMILWRAFVYYSWIIIGVIVVTGGAISNHVKKKKPVPTDTSLGIALFNDIFFPSVDGVVRTMDAYAREMTKCGHSVTVFCPRSSRLKDVIYNYSVFQAPSVKLPGFAVSTALIAVTRKEKRYLREHHVNVLHAHSPFMMGHIAVWLGRKMNLPVVSTFHSKYYDDALNITHSKLLSKILVNIIVDFYCKVDEVWACSEGAAETLRSYGFNGEIKVMENGVNPKPDGDENELERKARELLSLPADKKILLFVGQQIWHKNLRLILDATKALGQSRDDFVTVIAGKGYDENDIKKYAESLELGDKVLFTGEVTDKPTLFGLYRSAYLFFFPSVYDTSGLVIREAALARVPSLLVKGSSAAYVIEDGVNGYVAENSVEAMTAKLEEILDSDNIAEVGERAKETIPILWSEIAARVVDRYREAFGEVCEPPAETDESDENEKTE